MPDSAEDRAIPSHASLKSALASSSLLPRRFNRDPADLQAIAKAVRFPQSGMIFVHVDPDGLRHGGVLPGKRIRALTLANTGHPFRSHTKR
ncbi:hypothetical protein MPNT_150012 [Candidatus Methylacidithermus pantelleriae]|uniref:Uncharacterized protein n=1 Tax=Candidatus Methylacidithermus pantelleriae TaxID=2744239 RepID=A0A8J2FRT1_9BACT|nr:hypothetical protein MPNT_150012 [Candidatus Methylacidithermus pantelleriae]